MRLTRGIFPPNTEQHRISFILQRVVSAVRTDSGGRAVYCKNIYDGGKDVRFDREDIIGIVKPDCIPAWAKEKIAKLQAEKPSVMSEINQSKQETRDRPAKPKDAPGKKKSDPEL